MLHGTPLEYFVVLERYDSEQFQGASKFHTSFDIAFGLYVTEDGVRPEVLFSDGDSYFAYLTESMKLFDESSHNVPTGLPCYFCMEDIGTEVSYGDTPDFNSFYNSSKIIDKYVSDTHSGEGEVLKCDRRAEIGPVCESCFSSVIHLREVLFEENSAVVLSYEV